MEDITDRKLAEAALQLSYNELEDRVIKRTAQLQASKERVEAILNNSVDGIVLTNRDFNIQQINPAFDALFACESNAYLNQPLTKILAPESDNLTIETIQQRLADEKDLYITVRACRWDGTVFDAELGIGHVKSEGIVCVIRDITERKNAERTIAEERNLLRTVIDTVPHSIYVKDIQHRFLLTNAASNQRLGYDSSTLVVGKTDADFFTPEIAEKFMADERHLFETKTPLVNMEERSLRCDGQAIWVLTTKVPLYTVDGEVRGLVGITKDITERKQAEANLEKRNLTLTSLHTGSLEIGSELDIPALLPRIVQRAVDLLDAQRGGGIYLYDPDNNVMRLEAAIGINEHRIGNSLQPNLGVVGRVVQTGEPLIVNDYTNWDGRITVHEVHPSSAVMGVPLFIQGEVIGTLLVIANSQERIFEIEDVKLAEMFAAQAAAALHNAQLYSAAQREIASRQQSEAALRESEERFRQIAENFDQILFLRSEDDRQLLYVNPRYEVVWGKSRESLYANPDSFMEHIHPDDLDNIREHMQSKRNIEEGFADFEYCLSAPNQPLRWFRTRRFPIKNEDGTILRRAGIVEEITEGKLAENALRQALATEKELGELKSRFVSMASHEFRTPLATILAFTESLSVFRHKLTGEQIDKKLSRIREQVEYLNVIMEEVLLLARMQAQRVEFNPEPINLDTMCQTILYEFRSRPDVHHQLDYSCDTSISEVMLDNRLIRQIINNLLSNAIKYSTVAHPVQLNLASAHDKLILTVCDYGIGIPEADLKYLFEPFHRASNIGTISGTGLGLVIVKTAVELHHGTIEVESQVGKGSRFIVSIPIKFHEGNEDDKNSGD